MPFHLLTLHHSSLPPPPPPLHFSSLSHLNLYPPLCHSSSHSPCTISSFPCSISRPTPSSNPPPPPFSISFSLTTVGGLLGCIRAEVFIGYGSGDTSHPPPHAPRPLCRIQLPTHHTVFVSAPQCPEGNKTQHIYI